MKRPCVRVPRRAGESTRRQLAEAGILDYDHEILAESGSLYIPVVDPEAVPASFAVVEREVPERSTQTLPGDRLDFEPTYERLGGIVLLDEPDPERADAAAEAIMASDLPVKTVMNKRSPVSGEVRVREWDVLAGNGTETVHREYGCEFVVDVSQAYFSPRLATERHRVVEQVAPGERVFDMFAGVGPFAVPMAQRGAEVVAVDINEAAVAFLRENRTRNGVEDGLTVRCADVRSVADAYEGWADRIVMNLPHSADEFLGTAVQLAGDSCRVHYYDIQSDDDPFEPAEAIVSEAVSQATEVSIDNRRVVGSYAPGRVIVGLDVDWRRAPDRR